MFKKTKTQFVYLHLHWNRGPWVWLPAKWEWPHRWAQFSDRIFRPLSWRQKTGKRAALAAPAAWVQGSLRFRFRRPAWHRLLQPRRRRRRARGDERSRGNGPLLRLGAGAGWGALREPWRASFLEDRSGSSCCWRPDELGEGAGIDVFAVEEVGEEELVRFVGTIGGNWRERGVGAGVLLLDRKKGAVCQPGIGSEPDFGIRRWWRSSPLARGPRRTTGSGSVRDIRSDKFRPEMKCQYFTPSGFV